MTDTTTTVNQIAPATRSLATYLNRRMLSIFLLGFSSGLPLALTGGTLQAWFTTSGVDIVTIGFLSFIGMPYAYKYLWAPFMDRYIPPLLGRRRGWILLTQLALLLTIAAMAWFNPSTSPKLLGLLGIVVAFLSASQDIVYDAYKVDVLSPSERGLGAALGVEGYRLAMLASGAGALILADAFGWQVTYSCMSLLMIVGLVATWMSDEPTSNTTHTPANLREAFVKPFWEFFTRQKSQHGMTRSFAYSASFLLLIILYKLGDAFTLSLSTTFLLRELEFSLTAVGFMNKGVALVASLLGIFLGGTLMTRIKLFHALFFFGILQAVSSLAYMLLALMDQNYFLAINAIFIEYLCAGMGTAAFVALLMSLCNHRYTATQFALLSSFSAMGRIFVGPAAAYMVKALGWATFYLSTFFIAIPGLLLLWYLRPHIEATDNKNLGSRHG